MVRLAPQRVLLVGDSERQVQAALKSAAPTAHIVSVPSVFDGIAELTGSDYSAVFVAAEPIERRPDSAVRTLREIIGAGRLILFGHPTLEILSRKMLDHGCDNYIIMPPDVTAMKRLLAVPLRMGAAPGASATEAENALAMDAQVNQAHHVGNGISAAADPALATLFALPLAAMVLDAQLQHPHDSPAALVGQINAKLPAGVTIHVSTSGPGQHGRAASSPPAADADHQLISQILPASNGPASATPAADITTIHLLCRRQSDPALAQQALHAIAEMFAKLMALQDRHNRLQRLAVTDELTGLYNARYFRHFLTGIIERARSLQFTVSLLLFDIDDFKHYNDKYGHGVGDEILRQTAALMRRCCRDHDLVAHIGGDEFAVVFWDKEGPRQPRPATAPVSSDSAGESQVSAPTAASRRPQTPLEIFKRFKRLIETEDFSGLGSSGRGKLGISAGMASFPWNAPDASALIKAADDALMFGAKQTCKNTIYLVGSADEKPAG